MKMLIQVRGGWGRTQTEVQVQELNTTAVGVIAIHRTPGRYDMWTASDLLTGMAITSSISNKLVLAKAKKITEKNMGHYKKHQMHSLKKLYENTPIVDFKLLERIERKCVARGTSSVKTITIVDEFMDELYVQEG